MTRRALFVVILFVIGLLFPTPGCQAESINTRILNRAARLLETESQWSRADTRQCPQGVVKVSLHCALRQATAEEVGDSSSGRAHAAGGDGRRAAAVGRRNGDGQGVALGQRDR